MGLFSYFRDRRERESALSNSDQSEIEAALASAQAQAQAQPVQQGEVSGLEALGMLAAMFGQSKDMQAQGVDLSALQEGLNSQNITVDSQVIDMRGSGLREEIMGVIAAHGIDTNQQGQEITASEDMQKDIMAVLEKAGLNIDPSQFPTGMPATSAEPEEPMDPNVPQIRNPFER